MTFLDNTLDYINRLIQPQTKVLSCYEDLMSSQITQLLKDGFSLQDVFNELNLYNEKAIINLSVDIASNSVPLHSHGFYEVLLVLNGSVDYLIGTRRHVLQVGDIVLIPPGTPHQPLILEALNEPYKRFALMIDSTYLEDAMKKYPNAGLAFEESKINEKYLIRTNEPLWRSLRTHFDTIYKESSEMKPGWQLCVATETLNLAVQISRVYYTPDIVLENLENDTLMESILVYIDTHLNEKITLDNVAKYFLISQSKVSHMFKSQIGTSFYQCVVQRRLIAAKNGILQGLTLKEASERYGFPEYSSFYRLFKKEYGISPSKYFALQQKLKKNQS